MAFNHVGFVGDVLALELSAADGADPSHLFAGAYSPRSCPLLLCWDHAHGSGRRLRHTLSKFLIEPRVSSAGVGSQLLVYELPSGSLLHSCTVLPNAARVHGICVAPLSPRLLAVAVHGDHYAKVKGFWCSGVAATD